MEPPNHWRMMQVAGLKSSQGSSNPARVDGKDGNLQHEFHGLSYAKMLERRWAYNVSRKRKVVDTAEPTVEVENKRSPVAKFSFDNLKVSKVISEVLAAVEASTEDTCEENERVTITTKEPAVQVAYFNGDGIPPALFDTSDGKKMQKGVHDHINDKAVCYARTGPNTVSVDTNGQSHSNFRASFCSAEESSFLAWFDEFRKGHSPSSTI